MRSEFPPHWEVSITKPKQYKVEWKAGRNVNFPRKKKTIRKYVKPMYRRYTNWVRVWVWEARRNKLIKKTWRKVRAHRKNISNNRITHPIRRYSVDTFLSFHPATCERRSEQGWEKRTSMSMADSNSPSNLSERCTSRFLGESPRRKKLPTNLRTTLNFNSSIIRVALRKRFSINHELACSIFRSKEILYIYDAAAISSVIFIIASREEKKRDIFIKLRT